MLYALAAIGIGGYGLIASACIAEHVLGGAATVALFTLMMDASDLEYASTDYTLLACATVLAQGAATLSAGAIAQWFGYAPMFIASVLLSAGGCLLLISTLDRGHGPTRLRPVRSEEHTSELQSLMRISYAVFCLKKKKK